MSSTPGEVTSLLSEWANGNASARAELIALVFPILRDIASRQLIREGQVTLETGDLLNEACLRLLKSPPDECVNRGHFYAIAATVMRRVLVDQARWRDSLKRKAVRDSDVELAELPAPPDAFPSWIVLDQALEALRVCSEKTADVIDMHLVAGMELQECAELLDTSRATVVRQVRFGRAWLRNYLKESI